MSKPLTTTGSSSTALPLQKQGQKGKAGDSEETPPKDKSAVTGKNSLLKENSLFFKYLEKKDSSEEDKTNVLADLEAQYKEIDKKIAQNADEADARVLHSTAILNAIELLTFKHNGNRVHDETGQIIKPQFTENQKAFIKEVQQDALKNSLFSAGIITNLEVKPEKEANLEAEYDRRYSTLYKKESPTKKATINHRLSHDVFESKPSESKPSYTEKHDEIEKYKVGNCGPNHDVFESKPSESKPSYTEKHDEIEKYKVGNCGPNAVLAATTDEYPKETKDILAAVSKVRQEMEEIRLEVEKLKPIQEKMEKKQDLDEKDTITLKNIYSTIFGGNINAFKKFIEINIKGSLNSPDNTPETRKSVGEDLAKFNTALKPNTNFAFSKEIWQFILKQDINIEHSDMPKDTRKDTVFVTTPNIVSSMLAKGYMLINTEQTTSKTLLHFKHLEQDNIVYIAINATIAEIIANNKQKTPEKDAPHSGSHWYCVQKTS